MSQLMQHGRRWWILGAVLVVGALAAVPAGVIGQHLVLNSVGRTTLAAGADGSERTVYWRDYPGVAGIDSRQVLEGPTPEEGYEAGQGMVAEIRSALSAEFQLEWAPVDGDAGTSPFSGPVENQFGGRSLLTNVNGPESQSTSVPQAWADKQRAVTIIGNVSSRYGYAAPTLHGLEGWSAEERLRDLGGLTPDHQVIVSGIAFGPAGQWLSFRFQDLSKDTAGTFAARLRPPEGSRWQPNTVALSYGANGLLAAENRNEFESRLDPFRGLTPPEPLES